MSSLHSPLLSSPLNVEEPMALLGSSSSWWPDVLGSMDIAMVEGHGERLASSEGGSFAIYAPFGRV
jgi:hypothetical protein